MKNVKPQNVTLIDQSPHQLQKAKQKPALKDVTIVEVAPQYTAFNVPVTKLDTQGLRRPAVLAAHQFAQSHRAESEHNINDTTVYMALQGDAENLPFETDSFERYVSAGSIEYWPDPQRGIKEAYR